ncbi:cardiolipin synthase [Sediminihabitans luteus]|uniref:Cardiolipin synthase n=1 Tax=Sediminihabitans luteus TaxID=1138585 RepID=A0A2M9CQN9_9CELL|nr:phospholipase D-like domain-containing protein [Sediminihabitans luteus]PJJ74242.1 cardiolipin synthase [Sediminihabitans luteus]GII99095.1 major cardiolipin synthase ClsA [Sediminihabitans luteus]
MPDDYLASLLPTITPGRPLTERARKVVTRTALVAAAVPFAVAGAITVSDMIRRRSRPLSGKFPITPPSDTNVGDNSARVYTYGEDLFADMLAAIRGAQRTVMIESYIWKDDQVGREFKDAIEDAAARGVDVFVVYDGFANLVVPRKFLTFSPQVHVIRFPVFRPGILALNVRKSGRDHRKILVVDDEVGFVGGYNIGADYANQWRDTHCRLTGPAVWELRNAFVDFWNVNRDATQPPLEDPGSPVWDPHVRAARNAPAHLTFPIRNMYLDAIDRSTDRISITQAYFIPDAEILDGLLVAAARGVDVRVVVPERSNHVLADWLSRGHFTTLLDGGVRIFLFRDAMVHAKTMTIDGAWTTIGTANIDRLSLTGNYEVNIEIVDEGLAARMQDVFDTDLTNCRELTLDEWVSRPVVAKLSEISLRPLRPLL